MWKADKHKDFSTISWELLTVATYRLLIFQNMKTLKVILAYIAVMTISGE